VALDRQSIEKRDFPIGRRGYEPAAVDAHLARLADEVESLKQSTLRRSDALASTASEHVRLIVEAAEASAADIRGEAEAEAAGHVKRVADATAAMLERIDAMETELRTILEPLRAAATRVSADLAVLQAAVADLRGGAGGGRIESEPVPAAEPGAAQEPAIAAPEQAPPADEPVEAAGDAGAERRNGDGGEPEPDEEGARLIALNMALNGTPREETERYLRENFELADTERLLDDVYARAGQ
jgi:DivIVA domain-containing protein